MGPESQNQKEKKLENQKDIQNLSVKRENISPEKIADDMASVFKEQQSQRETTQLKQAQQADMLRGEIMSRPDVPTHQEQESPKNLFQKEDERWDLEVLAQQERNKKKSWKEFFGFGGK